MAYTPINWDEDTPITPDNLDNMDSQIDDNEDDLRTIQGNAVSVDGRITNLEGYVVGNNVIFESLSDRSTSSSFFTTLKEFLFGKKGNIRLTFETRINGSLSDEYVDYRILVDGSTVASGDHSGTDDWISYTEDISINVGSNVKFQLKTSSVGDTVYLRDVRVKVGNSSDNIIEL